MSIMSISAFRYMLLTVLCVVNLLVAYLWYVISFLVVCLYSVQHSAQSTCR